MKRFTQKYTWLVLVVVMAMGQPLGAQPPGQEADPIKPVATAQSVEEIKWTFGGNEAGFNRYQTNPDGTFESVSELNIAGISLKSRLSGKMVEGVLTEFEIVNARGDSEVKVTGKVGKAHIVAGEKTRDVDYKPAKAIFANIHPALSETLFKVIEPAHEGAQSIEVLVLDGAVTAKVDVSKKKTRTIEVGGQKQVVDVYLLRFSSLEFDLYLSQDAQFAAWDVPSQRLRAIRPGFENLLIDPTTLYPELSQPTLKTKSEKGVKIKLRDGVELVADVVRPADEGKYPAILERTPYGREILSQLEGEWWA
jgi:hypothetical protein